MFLLGRGLPAGGWAYGSYLLVGLLDDPSVIRTSVRIGKGGGAGMDPGMGAEMVGEISRSSASPPYRGMPSAPISILGGFRKWFLSRYSGEISKEANSGKDDGERRRPLSTSSIL